MQQNSCMHNETLWSTVYLTCYVDLGSKLNWISQLLLKFHFQELNEFGWSKEFVVTDLLQKVCIVIGKTRDGLNLIIQYIMINSWAISCAYSTLVNCIPSCFHCKYHSLSKIIIFTGWSLLIDHEAGLIGVHGLIYDYSDLHKHTYNTHWKVVVTESIIVIVMHNH